MADCEQLSEENIHALEALENLFQEKNLEEIENMFKIIFENEEYVENPFLFVCEKNILAMVKLFVKYKFGINQIDNEGMNGFIWACESDNLELVKFLFEKNCGIDQIDDQGTNGFIYAYRQNHIEIIMFLYEFGYVPSPSNELIPFASWFSTSTLEERINIEK